MTWANHLRTVWNNLDKQRNPLHYFQGALIPIERKPNGDLLFKYVGLKRQYEPMPFWHL